MINPVPAAATLAALLAACFFAGLFLAAEHDRRRWKRLAVFYREQYRSAERDVTALAALCRQQRSVSEVPRG